MNALLLARAAFVASVEMRTRIILRGLPEQIRVHPNGHTETIWPPDLAAILDKCDRIARAYTAGCAALASPDSEAMTLAEAHFREALDAATRGTP